MAGCPAQQWGGYRGVPQAHLLAVGVAEGKAKVVLLQEVEVLTYHVKENLASGMLLQEIWRCSQGARRQRHQGRVVPSQGDSASPGTSDPYHRAGTNTPQTSWEMMLPEGQVPSQHPPQLQVVARSQGTAGRKKGMKSLSHML